jgi:hypothetical protein
MWAFRLALRDMPKLSRRAPSVLKDAARRETHVIVPLLGIIMRTDTTLMAMFVVQWTVARGGTVVPVELTLVQSYAIAKARSRGSIVAVRQRCEHGG